MFERFTEDARRVVVFAQEESRLREDSRIGTEHLLLGLTHGPDVTSRALEDAGFDTDSGRQQFEATTPAWRRENNGHIPFTPDAKRTFDESLRVSTALGQAHIRTPHLLLGLLSLRDAGGIRLLSAVGVDVDSLTARAEELARASGSGSARKVGDDAIRVVASGAAGGTISSAYGRSFPAHTDEQQRDRLRAALVRYGRHDDDCDHDRVCSCGLTRVLADEVNVDGSAM